MNRKTAIFDFYRLREIIFEKLEQESEEVEERVALNREQKKAVVAKLTVIALFPQFKSHRAYYFPEL